MQLCSIRPVLGLATGSLGAAVNLNDGVTMAYRIIEKNGGKPPLTYHQFQNVVAGMDPPEPPVQTVTSVCVGSAYTPLKEDHDDHYGVPTLEELGKLSR